LMAVGKFMAAAIRRKGTSGAMMAVGVVIMMECER
jgi:hypothetical protein